MLIITLGIACRANHKQGIALAIDNLPNEGVAIIMQHMNHVIQVSAILLVHIKNHAVLLFCHSRYIKDKMTLIRFPEDELQRDAWIRAIKWEKWRQ